MYKKFTHGWFKHWDFILIDLICLQMSFWLAYMLRHGEIIPYTTSIYSSEAILLFVCQLVVIFFAQTYIDVLRRGYYREFVNTVASIAMIFLLTLTVLFVVKETGTYSRITLGTTSIIYVFGSYISRVLYKKRLKKAVKKEKKHSLIVVTEEEIAKGVLKRMTEDAFQQYFIKAVALIEDQASMRIEGYPVLNGEEELIDFACREWVDEVMFVLAAGNKVPDKVMDAVTAMGITTHVSILGDRVVGGKQYVEKIGGYTVLTTSMNIVTDVNVFYKRVTDIIGGIIGCIVTLVLILIVGPMIYIKSPGPIIFSQVRIGKNGKKFKMYKFRSMYLDAEERKKELMDQNKINGLMFKMDCDPRIIGSGKLKKNGKPKGIGNFIRETSIDEFPQFFNVLKGDMSLVGTRPPTVDEWEQYKPHHRARMSIKPGITGLWQISGRSDITEFEEVVKLDREYINNWNIGLDIKILLKTVLVVFRKAGSI